MRKKITTWKTNVHHLWLSLLLGGGALFGVVDHLWNGELFLIGDNIVFDLALGGAITLTIIIAWSILVLFNKTTMKKPKKQIT